MRLKNFRLVNQKCFLDTGELVFGPGFNIVVGVNNVGKSALLEGIQASFLGNPTRNVKTQPRETDVVNPISEVTLGIELSGAELRQILLRIGQQFQMAIDNEVPEANEKELTELEATLALAQLNFALHTRAGEGGGAGQLVGTRYPSFAQAPSNDYRVMLFQANSVKSGFEIAARRHDPQPAIEVGRLVGDAYRQRIYRFVAERMNLGKYAAGLSRDLAPSAINLPEVLGNLQSNHAKFVEYNSVVRQIFPTVDHVSVRQASASEVEVYVSSSAAADHLAVPLQRSGTGIAQVLSILYVVLTSAEPRTIVVDEPNSFLHPGAARKLMEVLRDFPAHQFIIATHSPEIIKSVPADRVFMIAWSNEGSTVTTIDATEVDSMTAILGEIGARISDVIAADNILWVEGISEEECFPIMLRELAGRKMSGTQFVALYDTGGFEKKHLNARAITRLYEKLSRGGSLVPRAIGFSFDREGRTDPEIAELQRKHPNIFFLPRRMLENFLIAPAAIAHVLNMQLSAETHVSAEVVAEWIKTNGAANKYLKPLPMLAVLSPEWMATVHAGKLLEDLFQDLSSAKAEFRKVRDNPKLVRWLLSNSSDSLKELHGYLEKIVSETGANVVGVLKTI